ncbi:NmrA family NAD(P)-binding protein [Serratia plymuthica]|uniref:NmrA family NAD(P)-binding protein n=1 Tax=Serratia plymuthica TaxID=82996 RepID=UPI0018D7CAFA|nr:NmrA family NAD(P)-binding protein [Serratia plymuthica]QPS57606.1 NmrA family NAD(P)-binding protein [Serratia plymuthica]CAI1542511.1 NAD(P)H azoreductase [Serratia plymuthica]
MSINQSKARILVIGSSGQVGKKVVSDLEGSSDFTVRVTSRRLEEVQRLSGEGKDIVYLDLDDPRTFGAALAGVDRIFLLTGYTVAMLAQSKTLVDAASKAGVKHIVHLGVFGEWDCTGQAFAWHQLVEAYIKASGISWTFLHPNMFMENILTLCLKGDTLTTYWGENRTGWVAAADIALVAATALREGPTKHAGKDYWLSSDVATGPELARLISETLGKEITANVLGPEEFQAIFTSATIPVESWYADGGVEVIRQVVDGRMGYIGSVRDDVPHITGQNAVTLKQWILEHRQELISIAGH